MPGCGMVVTPSQTEDAESSRFPRKGAVAEGRLELVQAGTTPSRLPPPLPAPHTHTHNQGPSRMLALIATCAVFVSPKDWKPPKAGSPKGLHEKVTFPGNPGPTGLQCRPNPEAAGHRPEVCAAGP